MKQRIKNSRRLKKSAVLGVGAAVLGVGAGVSGVGLYKYHYQWHLRYYEFNQFIVCIVCNRSKPDTDIHIIGLYEESDRGLSGRGWTLVNANSGPDDNKFGTQYESCILNFHKQYQTDKPSLKKIPAEQVQGPDCILQTSQNTVRDMLRKNDSWTDARTYALRSGLMRSNGEFQQIKESWILEYWKFEFENIETFVCIDQKSQ